MKVRKPNILIHKDKLYASVPADCPTCACRNWILRASDGAFFDGDVRCKECGEVFPIDTGLQYRML
jgi:uncharacterized Zn finger protein